MSTMKMKEVFSRIAENNSWGSEESLSGPGSTLHATRFIRKELPRLCFDLGVKSILDIPCGDFVWMRQIDWTGYSIEYIGADIVDSLIEANRKKYARPGYRFEVLDLTQSTLPCVDLVFCKDCLVHLPIKDIHLALQNVLKSDSRWLLTTHFPWLSPEANSDIALGGWRRLKIELPPFSLKVTRSLIEGCDADGYQDKCLALIDLEALRKTS